MHPMRACLWGTGSAGRRRHRGGAAGFTLVEILVVVVILAVLAAIVVPQFTSADTETRQNTLKMNLHHIRQQIEIYKHQHGSNWPRLNDFEAQMTEASDSDGQTAAPGTPGYPHGPYLSEIPPNPFTSDNEVGDGPIGSSDWYYNENTGEFRANHDPAYADL